MENMEGLRAIPKPWRIELHDALIESHAFVQDPDDILGGCKICWRNIEGTGGGFE